MLDFFITHWILTLVLALLVAVYVRGWIASKNQGNGWFVASIWPLMVIAELGG